MHTIKKNFIIFVNCLRDIISCVWQVQLSTKTLFICLFLDSLESDRNKITNRPGLWDLTLKRLAGLNLIPKGYRMFENCVFRKNDSLGVIIDFISSEQTRGGIYKRRKRVETVLRGQEIE